MSRPGPAPSLVPQRWSAVDAGRLSELLASWVDGLDGAPRVAIDGPPCAGPHVVAESLLEPLRVLGRPATHVVADTFWRDASVRLEHGHQDVLSYPDWLDRAALRRETLEPFGAGRDYLASLRDPLTNRSTREAPRAFVPGSVLIVSGTFLLGGELPFDRTVHLVLPPASRARRTPPEQAWTLPAFDDYDATVHPSGTADVAVRLDRRSPAVRGLPGAPQ